MSYTVNILCYKPKTLSNGENPLMICISKDGKRKYQSLGVSIDSKYWDFEKNKPKRNCPNKELIQKIINNKLNELSTKVLEFKLSDKDFTATNIIKPNNKSSKKYTVEELFESHIKQLKQQCRRKYALTFEELKRSLLQFNKHLDIYFSDIDIEWLKSYENRLKSKGLRPNSIGVRVRTLRVLHNIKIQGLMLTQRKELNFEGQNIYTSIDVHLKSWTVSILTETISHKRFTMPPQAQVLACYLKEKFSGASYHSAYEAGFCGFSIHYQLLELGIDNIVINPADVPTTQKEQYHKSDSVDSYKIARSLRAGELTPIHVLRMETLEERSLIRTRSLLVRDMTRFKLRIKSFLYFYGVSYPPEFSKSQNHYTPVYKLDKRRCRHEIRFREESLLALVSEVESQRELLLKINREIRNLSHSEKYERPVRLIQSVPGIGIVNAMTFLTEIEDINRFKSTDHLASFVGLIPKYHSSGEREITGEITFRGLTTLKQVLVESSWIAARIDPALSLAFNTYVKRMPPNKAIIRIARKLLNRIYYVLKNDRAYVTGIVK